MTNRQEDNVSPSWPPASSELCWHCPASFPEKCKAYGESDLCFTKYLHWRREGLLYIVTDLGREGGNCSQVSRSQFSQLHIIIWFRYLIHALKPKTHLELTTDLLSHSLLCREMPSASPSAALDLGTDRAWKRLLLTAMRKGEGIKQLMKTPVTSTLLCLMIFFFFQTVTNEKEELIGVWLHLLFLRQSGVYRISCSCAAILERLKNTARSKKNQRAISEKGYRISRSWGGRYIDVANYVAVGKGSRFSVRFHMYGL